MPVVNYRNGEQTTGAAWSVRRYSKRKAELPTMSRYFLHFWRNGKPLSVKSAVCLYWLVPCGSAPATGDSILRREKPLQNSKHRWIVSPTAQMTMP